jgi:hypothetical protein
MATYRIIGAFTATGKDCTIEFEATDATAAESAAVAAGILISELYPVPADSPPLATSAPAARSRSSSKYSRGEVLRRLPDKTYLRVHKQDITLGDVVMTRNGKAYMRVAQSELLASIVIGILISHVLTVVVGMIILFVFFGGLLAMSGATP